jgi:hypothetical protein
MVEAAMVEQGERPMVEPMAAALAGVERLMVEPAAMVEQMMVEPGKRLMVEAARESAPAARPAPARRSPAAPAPASQVFAQVITRPILSRVLPGLWNMRGAEAPDLPSVRSNFHA